MITLKIPAPIVAPVLFLLNDTHIICYGHQYSSLPLFSGQISVALGQQNTIKLSPSREITPLIMPERVDL
jgi:hypothetical protein